MSAQQDSRGQTVRIILTTAKMLCVGMAVCVLMVSTTTLANVPLDFEVMTSYKYCEELKLLLKKKLKARRDDVIVNLKIYPYEISECY